MELALKVVGKLWSGGEKKRDGGNRSRLDEGLSHLVTFAPCRYRGMAATIVEDRAPPGSLLCGPDQVA
ncbi:MAG TPA: hypothetical protein VGU03_07495 [Frateuria sp.]|uniref:hypothetical protein n=1 Tax=Frateuria sp. TaxID=2211372 RepID=UPI002DE85481|nr:hypothetical protein [Frateuria sp.]